MVDIQVWLSQLDVPAQATFNIVNLACLCLSLWCLYRLMPSAGGRGPKLIALSAIIVWLPILFLFTAYTSGYDDCLQWALLLLGWLLFTRGYHWGSTVAIGLGVLVRETTLVFAFFLMLTAITHRKFYYAASIASISLLALYLLSLHPAATTNLEYAVNRPTYSLRTNFKDVSHSLESILIVWTVGIAPLATVLLAYRKCARLHTLSLINIIVIAVVGTVNLITIVLFASIHESRLFVIGLFGLAPLLGYHDLQTQIIRCMQSMRPLYWAIIISVSFIITFIYYTPSIGRSGIIYVVYMWPYLSFTTGTFAAVVLAALKAPLPSVAHTPTLKSVPPP